MLVDLITKKDELATVVTYAANLGYRVEIRRGSETHAEGWPEAVLTREDMDWADRDIASQVILAAIANGETPRRVMERVTAILAGKSVESDALVPPFTRSAIAADEGFDGGDDKESA